MSHYSLQTPEQVRADLASRVRALRLTKGWKQATLAERSGVSLASLRRFETTGKISLDSLLKLAFSLYRLDDFDDLLKPPPAATIDDLDRPTQPSRKRGRL